MNEAVQEVPYKRLLTIQDVSCLGQCSLTVALPVVSACGVECAVLPSAVLSTHTGGFDGWTFRDLTEDMSGVEAAWRRQGVRFDAFYTGYVCASQVEPILSIMSSCANPGALRLVDPVLGDNGRLYAGFDASFPRLMARLCAGADSILPNLTEAAFLLGEEPVLQGYDRSHVERTVRGLHALGAKNVVLTGVSFDEGLLGTAVSDGETVEYYFTPRLVRTSRDGGRPPFRGDVFHGTGDLFASAFAGAVVRGLRALDAAALAADVVCAAIEATPPGHWYGVAFERAIPFLVDRLRLLQTSSRTVLAS